MESNFTILYKPIQPIFKGVLDNHITTMPAGDGYEMIIMANEQKI